MRALGTGIIPNEEKRHMSFKERFTHPEMEKFKKIMLDSDTLPSMCTNCVSQLGIEDSAFPDTDAFEDNPDFPETGDFEQPVQDRMDDSDAIAPGAAS